MNCPFKYIYYCLWGISGIKTWDLSPFLIVSISVLCIEQKHQHQELLLHIFIYIYWYCLVNADCLIYEILNSGSVSSFIYKYTTLFALVDTFKPYSSGLNLRRTTLLQSTGDYLVKNNKTTALFSGIFIYIFLIKEKKMSRTFVDLPVHGLINQSLCLNSNYLFNKKNSRYNPHTKIKTSRLWWFIAKGSLLPDASLII